MFDEHFGKIYASGSERLAGKHVAAFSIAEIERSSNKTLAVIETIVGDCKGIFDLTMIVTTKHSVEEIAQRIEQFTDQCADELQ